MPARAPSQPLPPPPAMNEAEGAALAVALARLCAESAGDWRGRNDDLLTELSARLPAAHPALTGGVHVAVSAARAANTALEPHGLRVLSGHRGVRIRLIPNDGRQATNK